MYFLYILLICYTSTLVTPVNSYVVLAANLNDFRAIAKKFAPKDLVNQIKALVLENGHKAYRELSIHDKQVDRSVEYEEVSKHDENSYELAPELKAALAQQLTNGYKLKRTPKVVFVEPLRKPHVRKIATPATVLTLNDIVQKVKENLLKEFIESDHVLGNTLADKMQPVSSQVYNNVNNKYATSANKAKARIKKPVYNSVPMKVLKEEVQFEASYEDIDDKPHMQYYSESYKPILNKSPANNNNYPFIYAKNIIPQKTSSKKWYDGPKKVRLVKQVLVPAHSNQGQSVHVSQSNFIPQPSLAYQSNSNLEPYLSMQKESMVQQPLHLTNANIAQQLALMQQQINQLTKNAQDRGLKKKPALDSPHLNIEAIDAHFHILPQSVKEDENETNDSQENQDELTEPPLSGETTVEPAVTKTSTKDLTAPGVVENEQFVEEEDAAVSVENEEGEEATENKPEEVTEKNSDEDDSQAYSSIIREVKVDNNVRVGSQKKVHTQDFGNPNAGEPVVEKTYNFNAPTKEAGVPSVNINIPFRSARKVMLF